MAINADGPRLDDTLLNVIEMGLHSRTYLPTLDMKHLLKNATSISENFKHCDSRGKLQAFILFLAVRFTCAQYNGRRQATPSVLLRRARNKIICVNYVCYRN